MNLQSLSFSSMSLSLALIVTKVGTHKKEVSDKIARISKGDQ